MLHFHGSQNNTKTLKREREREIECALDSMQYFIACIHIMHACGLYRDWK